MFTYKRCAIVFSLAVFLTPACGNNKIGSNPCEGPAPLPSCGDTCSDTQPCPTGFHCGDDGTCTAECTPAGGGCASGEDCDPNGYCVPGNGGSDAGNRDALNCPDVMVSVEPVTPTVQLLIDQSGSMTEDFGGITRWTAVNQALVDPTNGAVTVLQDEVRFGASLYSSLGGNAGGACPLLVETSPRLNNRDAIANLLSNNDPQSDTPTAEAVTAIANAFPPEDPNDPGPRIIVLATDGNPDNCVDPDAHDLGSQMMSEAAVQGAYNLGLQTFVLSVGDQVAQGHLQKLANAGQGLDLDTGNATFYVANNSAELVAAFTDIVRGVRTCTFTLDGVVMDPNTGSVVLNGVQLDYGVDWTMPNNATIQLLGNACDTALNEDIVELTAVFPCGTVIL